MLSQACYTFLMPLKNKVAIVTGSGQGIGLGIATALAQQGCNIVITDINQEACDKAVSEIKKLSVDVLSIVCDVSVKKDVENLVVKTVEHFGHVDILVNNAGIYPFVPFEKMTEDNWDKVMNVNLKGIFLCTSRVLAAMKAGAKIINISSIASLVGFEGLVHYCTSKGGVNAFTRALALELAPKKINVNAVAPGAISTPGATMSTETQNSIIKSIPSGRIGNPADIASIVLYLASDEADYVTGQVITVDGGWTAR